jgi:hypothetical protein
MLACLKCSRSLETDAELARHLVIHHGFHGEEAVAVAARIESEGKRGRQGEGGGPANRSGRCGHCHHPEGRHGAACPKAAQPEVSVMGEWTCTACGQQGHTSRSKDCPKNGEGKARQVVKLRPVLATNGHGDPLKDLLAQRIAEKQAELAKLEAAMQALA